MAFPLIWSPSARLDIKGIAGFIAEDSPRLPHDSSRAYSKLWRD